MPKETITLEIDGVLRFMAADDDLQVMGSDSHPLIGIAFRAVATPPREPIPIEIAVTPRAAAGLLAMLLDMELDGRIPKTEVRSVKTTRQ